MATRRGTENPDTAPSAGLSMPHREAGALNLGGSIDMIPNAVRIAELAVDKQRTVAQETGSFVRDSAFSA
jgi:hypothetical protein